MTLYAFLDYSRWLVIPLYLYVRSLPGEVSVNRLDVLAVVMMPNSPLTRSIVVEHFAFPGPANLVPSVNSNGEQLGARLVFDSVGVWHL